MKYFNTLEFAKQQDEADPIKAYREKFYFPQINGREAVYFTGTRWAFNLKQCRIIF